MPVKGYTWNEEYRAKFYASQRVQEHMEKFVEQARQPKGAEQREKMRLAKLDRKYSDQHKANMAAAQRFRQALKRDIQAKNPTMPAEQVWQLVREHAND